MISWTAYFLSWLVWYGCLKFPTATEDGFVEYLAKEWKNESKPITPPSSKDIETDEPLTEDVEEEGNQRWQLWSCKKKNAVGEGRKDKIVVYWHGGGFVLNMTSAHWSYVYNIVRDTGVPVVIPNYTLVPFSTLPTWKSTAIQFILDLADKYPSAEIVMMGDSAGGWCTLALIQILCDIASTEGHVLKDRTALVMERIQCGILISPVIDPTVTQEVEALDKLDVCLGVVPFIVMEKLWTRGPATYPHIDFHLPPNTPRPEAASSDDMRLPNHLETFTKYQQAYPDRRPVHLIVSIGTNDCSWPAIRDMFTKMGEMPDSVVKYEAFIEEGLFHIYALLFGPEANKVNKRVREVLAEDKERQVR